MSLFAYSGPPTRSGIGRAQVMLSVDDSALEKSSLGTRSFDEETTDEPMLSTVA